MPYLGNLPLSSSFASKTEKYSGDGSTLTFTLSREVHNASDIEVLVNNVQQDPDVAYTVNGSSTITFTEAPTNASNNIIVTFRNYNLLRYILDQDSINADTLTDNSVTNPKIAASAVTANKISNGTITGDKITTYTIGSTNLTNTGVSSGNYGSSTNVPVINVDAAGRVTYAANVAIPSEVPFSNTTALAQAQAIALSFN